MLEELLRRWMVRRNPWLIVGGLAVLILAFWILMPPKKDLFPMPDVHIPLDTEGYERDLQEIEYCKDQETCRRFESKGEKICRQTLEGHFHRPFSPIRPDWLKNESTGRNLEIDCYNEDLKLGVEYNGIQHYYWKENSNFGLSYDDFLRLQERDKIKAQKCSERGVKLIVVPYTVKHEMIPQYLINKLTQND